MFYSRSGPSVELASIGTGFESSEEATCSNHQMRRRQFALVPIGFYLAKKRTQPGRRDSQQLPLRAGQAFVANDIPGWAPT